MILTISCQQLAGFLMVLDMFNISGMGFSGGQITFARYFLLGVSLIMLNVPVFPQTKDELPQTGQKEVIAGSQYGRSSLHQLLWGKHYRKDWATKVTVAVLYLDTINGGLTAYQKGGGRQSKTLRLSNKAGKEYVLRSIDKSFGKALNEMYRGTFIEKIIDDQVSIAQPYSAITIPSMAEAAGIYHTNPVIVFIPKQKALGEFNEEFGDDLYLFEQRPDENWEEAANFANSKKIISTEKMLEEIFENNDDRADQRGFVRARLFDMFIGDWGRHEDQWRWATIEDGDKKIFKPIPRDRDQAYTKFDGALLSIGISAAGAGHLETFSGDIKDVGLYNFPARNLDRQIANEVSKEEWIDIAQELKSAMTDAVIEDAVRKLPPAVFSNSGQEMINKLKSRRDKLPAFANDYYLSLAREVEVVGTHKDEYFSLINLSSGEMEVSVFDLNKEGKPKKKPFYTRKFRASETKEIRIYGLTGTDQYVIDNRIPNAIKVRIIGGPAKDKYTSSSAGNIHIYDNRDNDLNGLNGAKKHLSDNPFVHQYIYDGFSYDKKGIGPIISYNTEDHIHVGLKYSIEKQQWRKYPFGQKHELAARYSISEGAFSFGYESVFKSVIGKWDLHLNANYDLVRWNNFFGIGNETIQTTEERDFNRVRTKEFYAGIGLQRIFRHYHQGGLTLFYQTIEILNDPGRFLTTQTPKFTGFDPKQYAGARLDYVYLRVDNGVVTRKGMRFGTTATFMQGLSNSDSMVANISSVLNIWVPLTKSFVFALKTGAAMLNGEPEFYQLNRLSGSKTLRGFRKYRFYGESMFYNQAELQFLRPVKTFLFNGTAGLIGFFDIGRIWHWGEESNVWHKGYGGGIFLAPFNKISIAVFYGKSKNEQDYSIRLLKGL